MSGATPTTKAALRAQLSDAHASSSRAMDEAVNAQGRMGERVRSLEAELSEERARARECEAAARDERDDARRHTGLPA